MKKLLVTLTLAAGISLITIPALARGPYYGQERGPHGYYGQKYRQCPYDNNNCYGSSSWRGHRFGDGTQPRPQDGTGFGFKHGFQKNTQ